ncbi:histidine phosphatase family protein [Lederbergia panacisoli]|uniref:histidine phosphatase family protein n=1 Tax=Lederbergia panacisoli TaxID=1255251 RepID=UPI00214BC704|nr:histidine phosphatase family protein [Lederbergia panacisoli]MCR2821136.1 histidine phosphatase family protein [Lederbergia panacisoli]
MKTNLYFVRHAHSTYTSDERGRPLSVRGLKDAQLVTDLLKLEKIERVISSPYKRAIQTVEGISKWIDKEIRIEEGFKERKLAGVPVEDFNEAIVKVWENPEFSWEGGESNISSQQRGVEITRKILHDFEGNNVAIGTHGNIMVLIMNYFDPKFNFTFWEKLAMPDIYKLTFEKTQLVDVKQIWR